MATETTQELQEQLALYRRTYQGASERAAKAWALVQRLQEVWIRVPVKAGLACIRDGLSMELEENGNSDVDDILADLPKHVAKVFPNKTIIADKEYFVFKPYFPVQKDDEHELIGYLNFGYLGHTGQLKAIKCLSNVFSTDSLTGQGLVTGVSDDELKTLVGFNKRKTLELVNAMRHLVT